MHLWVEDSSSSQSNSLIQTFVNPQGLLHFGAIFRKFYSHSCKFLVAPQSIQFWKINSQLFSVFDFQYFPTLLASICIHGKWITRGKTSAGSDRTCSFGFVPVNFKYLLILLSGHWKMAMQTTESSCIQKCGCWMFSSHSHDWHSLVS